MVAPGLASLGFVRSPSSVVSARRVTITGSSLSLALVYHFMFDPSWDAGCEGCSLLVDNIGHLAHLHARATTLVLASCAPVAKLLAYRERMGWPVPWYSSHASAFNYDFHVTLDESVAPVEYNYRDKAELIAMGDNPVGEGHGVSVFLRDGTDVFHTYSTYAAVPTCSTAPTTTST